MNLKLNEREAPLNELRADAPRLEHALIEVSNLEACLAFWALLAPGWQVTWDARAQGEPWVHLGPGGGGRPPYLSLWQKGDESQPGRGLRVRHLGFEHADVRGMVARLKPLGIQPTDYVEEHSFRRAYFADPDGHVLEFVEGMEPPGHM